MKEFGVAGGLVQKLINDVSNKDLLTQDEIASLLKSVGKRERKTGERREQN